MYGWGAWGVENYVFKVSVLGDQGEIGTHCEDAVGFPHARNVGIDSPFWIRRASDSCRIAR